MSRIYDTKFSVSPFIISPVGSREATPLLFPRIDPVQIRDIIDRLYHHMVHLDLKCPIINCIFPYGRKLVIGLVFQTTAKDQHSGRQGLKLTCGAIVDTDIFFDHPSVCVHVFELMDEFFKEVVQLPLGIEGANELVARYQQRDSLGPDSDYSFDLLLSRFESDFGAADSESPNVYDRLRKLLNFNLYRDTRVKSVSDIDSAREFWGMIDRSLYVGQERALSDQPRPRSLLPHPLRLVQESTRTVSEYEMRRRVNSHLYTPPLIKDEYILLLQVYRELDVRVFILKVLSLLVSIVVIGISFYYGSRYTLLFAICTSLTLWIMDAYWRGLQSLHLLRIASIEEAFQTNTYNSLMPYRILLSWFTAKGEFGLGIWRHFILNQVSFPHALIVSMIVILFVLFNRLILLS